MKCTHCKQECEPKVFSAGDYDPFCSQVCHDEFFRNLYEEMSRINKMSSEEFRNYMMGAADDRE